MTTSKVVLLSKETRRNTKKKEGSVLTQHKMVRMEKV